MQKILQSNTENQTGYQPDEFVAWRVVTTELRRGLRMQLRWTYPQVRRSESGPCSQSTAQKNAAAFHMVHSSVWLDYLSPESFVSFHGTLRDRRVLDWIGRFFFAPQCPLPTASVHFDREPFLHRLDTGNGRQARVGCPQVPHIFDDLLGKLVSFFGSTAFGKQTT